MSTYTITTSGLYTDTDRILPTIIDSNYSIPFSVGLYTPVYEKIYGTVNKVLFSTLPFTKSGAVSKSFYDIVYNQVWIVPDNINAGLVSKDIYQTLIIWNAFRDRNIDISIEKLGLSDNELIVSPIPNTLTPDQCHENKILIKLVGSFMINGSFNFTLSDFPYIFVIKVSGIRVLLLPLTTFFQDNFAVTLSIPVSISTTWNLKEQRRLVVDKMLKTITASAVKEVTKSSIFNKLERSGGKVAAIPIVTEKISQVLNDIYGVTSFYINEDVSNYIWLYETSLLFIIDTSSEQMELTSVTSVDATNKVIQVSSPISGHFNKNTTEIYPALICTIEKCTTSAIDVFGKLRKFDMEFREMPS